MLTVNDLHPEAMDLAESAFLARKNGQFEKAKTLFHQALELEQQAASLLPPNEDSEPTRAILYRSAAALAYHGEQYETAERLITDALSGYPPPEIKQELNSLSEDVKFHRHLNHVQNQFEGKPLYLTGILRYADSTNDDTLGVVKLVELETNQKHSLLVPIALMKNVVRPYYEENVIITAFSDGKDVYLGGISLNTILASVSIRNVLQIPPVCSRL